MKQLAVPYETVITAIELHLKSLSLIDDNDAIWIADGIEKNVLVKLKKDNG